MTADGPDPGSEILVVGASGHALVCIDVLQAVGYRVAGCVEVEERRVEVGVAVLGYSRRPRRPGVRSSRGVRRGDRQQGAPGAHSRGDLARRSPRHRDQSARRTLAVGPRPVVALLLPGAVVSAGATIGDGAIVNTNAAIDFGASIGARSPTSLAACRSPVTSGGRRRAGRSRRAASCPGGRSGRGRPSAPAQRSCATCRRGRQWPECRPRRRTAVPRCVDTGTRRVSKGARAP